MMIYLVLINSSLFAQFPEELESCATFQPLILTNSSTSTLMSYYGTNPAYSFIQWGFRPDARVGTLLNNSMQNVTFGAGSLAGGVTLFDIIIKGDFYVDEDFSFFYCTIYMDPGAHIIIRGNKRLFLDQCHLLCCHGPSNNGMWQGITVGKYGQLSLGYSIIEDANIAVDLEDESSFSSGVTIFNRNIVGINFQGPNMDPAVYFSNNPPNGFGIEKCYFTTWHFPVALNYVSNVGQIIASAAITPFSEGQLNNKLGKQGHCGVIANNMVSFNNNPRFTIGDSRKGVISSTNYRNYFQFLEYGIINNNSHLKIINSEFKDLNANAGSTDPSAGTGIYTQNRSANIMVGGMNSTSELNTCDFINCNYGIRTTKFCQSINVINNNFTNCITAGIEHVGQNNNSISYTNNNFTDCFQGIRAVNTYTPTSFSISNNVFNKNALSTSATNFSDNAIYVSNYSSSPIRGNINSNEINDDRIGIYVINISKLNINSNYINFNRDIPSMLNQSHYGIWIDKCPNSSITENRITCTQTAVDPSSYKTLVRGLNLKAFGNSSVSFNEINHCGTAMRFVDNCTYTYMQCNSMDNNGTGWFAQTLGGPVLSTQGNGTRELHNIWSNTPSSSTSFKVDGSGAPLPFAYYHSGLDVPTNDLAPNPYKNTILTDFQGLSPNLETCNAQFVNDSLNDQEIFNNYNDSILSVLSLDKIFSELYFKFYKYPDQRSTEQTDWMLDHQFTCGVYNRLFNDTINRESIIYEFVNMPSSTNARLNEKKDLFYRTLVNEIAGFDSLPYTGINLEELAWTNSWDGTEAVFLARAILGEEVDDQENNLRTAKNNLLTSECGNILLNNIGEIRNTQFAIIKITVSEMNGRKVFETYNINQYNNYVSQNNKSGMYLVDLISSDCQKTFKIVLK